MPIHSRPNQGKTKPIPRCFAAFPLSSHMRYRDMTYARRARSHASTRAVDSTSVGPTILVITPGVGHFSYYDPHRAIHIYANTHMPQTHLHVVRARAHTRVRMCACAHACGGGHAHGTARHRTAPHRTAYQHAAPRRAAPRRAARRTQARTHAHTHALM